MVVYLGAGVLCVALHIRERDRTSLSHWREKFEDRVSWINKYACVRWLCNCLTCGMLNSDDEDDLERESSSSSSSSSNNRLSERSDGSHILSDDGSFLDEEAEVGDDGLFPHERASLVKTT